MKKQNLCIMAVFCFLILGSCLHDTPSEYYVQLLLGGSGTIDVDWGDGTQTFTYKIPDNYLSINHWISGSAVSTVTITGDNIMYLEIVGSGLADLTIDLNAGISLESFNFRNDNNSRGRRLTSLDVGDCTALKTLYCYGAGLTALGVNNCTALETLYCYGTGLAFLDVSTCKALMSLYCYGSGLETLDVSSCTSLALLDCSRNKLSTLDLSDCTALIRLYCGANELTSLDVSACPDLTTLDCYGNKLDDSALDALFWTLPEPISGIIYIYGNPGAVGCIKHNAEDKGWKIIG